MPAKGKTRVTDAQRRKIAQGKLAGKRRSVIAAEVGLAESTVSNQLADPRTVTLILRFKDQHAPELESMFAHSLKTLNSDLHSRNKAVVATARGQLYRLIPLGDPPLLRIAPNDNSEGDFTLEDLLITMTASYRNKTTTGE